MLKLSDNSDVNYRATVVLCPPLEVHPNADRLQLVSIFGGKVVIGKDQYTEGQPLVYFPVESAIDAAFLSWANLLNKPELNADGVSKGFFEDKGRVRAVKLREIPSEGFLYPVTKLAEYFKIPEKAFVVGKEFDMIGDKILVKKYISGARQAAREERVKKVSIPKWLNSAVQVLPRPIRKPINSFLNRAYRKPEGIKELIREGQFHLHYDTSHLGRNAHMINPDDEITITEKLHGTSAVFANVLAKPVVPWYKKPFAGSKEEYTLVYASRNTYKNRRDGRFTEDVWGHWAEKLKDLIDPGITLYGEIVGFNPNSAKTIQKNYDYGYKVGESGFFVYRITHTNPNGVVTEYTWKEIEDYCKDKCLISVPEHYHGVAKDLFKLDTSNEYEWREKFLERLREEYLEKDCTICKSKVPNEGIVVKNNTHIARPVFKFKSSRFLLKETQDRDAGLDDMEELA